MLKFFRRKSVPHPAANYSYVRTIPPGPGAEAFAFNAGTIPPRTDLYGGGRAVGQMRVTQSPQLFVPAMAALAAMKGTLAGQFISAPLFDPEENS